MPELPEVETVMRGLAVRLAGRRITDARVNRADLRWAIPPDLAATLRGARVSGLRRRAKYILVELEGRGRTMLLHLGMSGRISIADAPPPDPVRHEHLVIETDDGWRIALVDPRRFGCVDLIAAGQEGAHPLLRHLGPEPIDPDLDAAWLRAALAGRRVAVKAALLDQRIVAGLGNIYVCEALFRAGIHPARIAGTLTADEAARLAPAIATVLREAVAAGGSSLRDYVQPDGELGFFQHSWRVYGRGGAPCPTCPGARGGCPGVARIVQGGRSSFFCPVHQH